MKGDEDLGRDRGIDFETDDEENQAETVYDDDDETESDATAPRREALPCTKTLTTQHGLKVTGEHIQRVFISLPSYESCNLVLGFVPWGAHVQEKFQ